MTATQLRKKVHRYVDQVDDSFLHVVHAMIEEYITVKKDIVAHTAEGKPLTREEYVQRVVSISKKVDKGQSTTQDTLRKESENW